MGIDYDGIGGIGILLNEEIIDSLIVAEIFTREKWEDDPHDCIEDLNIPYSPAGSYYTGDIIFYLLVDGLTLKDVNANAPSFCEKLSLIGINTSPNELRVISDQLIS